MASIDKEMQARKHARVNGDPSCREPEADPENLSDRQKDHLIRGGSIGEGPVNQTQYRNFLEGEDAQFNAK